MLGNLKIPVIFSAVDKVSEVTKSITKSTEGLTSKLKGVATAGAVVGATLFGAMSASVNEAVKFEDKLADVAKTTGLEGEGLQKYGDSVLSLAETTRSSIDDILEIGAIGGQLGIAQDQLEAFTKSANQFAVALGGDYSGGVEEAISSVGKLNKLYKDTKSLSPDVSLMKTGSVLNQLSAEGSATAQNMNDFLLRLGALPDALKPSFTEASALGATLEELGLNSEVGASGLSNLLLKAGTEIGAFSRQMKISSQEAKALLNNNPAEFAVRFAKSFKGMNATQIANTLKDLKIGSNEVTKVVGILASGSEVYASRLATANQQMKEATSLTDEYNVKNSTSQAELEKAQNKIKSLSISIGQDLLPVLAEILSIVGPIISKFSAMAKENENFTKILVAVVAGLFAFKGIMIALPTIIGAVQLAYGAYMALFSTSVVLTKGGTMAQASYIAVTKGALLVMKAYGAVQAWVNGIMMLNPVGLIVSGIVLLVGLITVAIYKWEEWGAMILAFLGPIGLLINFIMELRKNWEAVKQAFKDGGIMGALEAIGKVFISSLLRPVQQLLEMVSDLPLVGDMASNALAGINGIQSRLSLDGPVEKLDSPQTTQTKNISSWTNSTNVGVEIRDPFGAVAGVSNSNKGIPLKVSRTNGNN